MSYLFLEKDCLALVDEIRELQEGLSGRTYLAERHLKYLRDILSQAEIVAPKKDGVVGIGSVVTVKYLIGEGHWKKRTYTAFDTTIYEIGSYLVFPSGPNRVSYDSWIGRGLLGAQAGQTRKINMGAVDVGAGKILTDFTLEVLAVINA